MHLLIALSEGDGDRAGAAFREMGTAGREFNEQAFSREVGQVVSRFRGRSPGETALALAELSTRHDIRFPPEVIHLGETLSGMERVIKDLDSHQILVGADVAAAQQIRDGDSLKLFDESFDVVAVLPETGTVDDDLRLAAGSPCVNAGDDAALPTDDLDLDGDEDTDEPLPLDPDLTDRIKGCRVDVGAFESAHDGIADGDVDGDGLLNCDEPDEDLDGDGLPNYHDDDSDGDGVTDDLDLCPDTPADVVVDPGDGCPVATSITRSPTPAASTLVGAPRKR